MKPAAFDYVRVEDADEAVELLAHYGEDARVLAGGQSLMAILNMRLAQPRVLVDIARASDLAAIEPNGALTVGAAVTQATLAALPQLGTLAPMLAQALPHIGHVQTRNRGTVCGSIAHADPSAELPLVLVALGGDVRLRSRHDRRTVPADAFFTGMLSTARRPDEIVEAVRFPGARPGARYRFGETAMRHGDFAVVALAAVADATRVRFAVGGVADRPRAVEWPKLSGSALDDALNQFAWELDAQDDHHATARYRRHLVRKLGRRMVEELG